MTKADTFDRRRRDIMTLMGDGVAVIPTAPVSRRNNDVDYHHDTAINHTKKMVKEIRTRGIKVLSYFIGDSYDARNSTSAFNRMYGSDAQFIDVTSVISISKTMNKKFLEK